MKCAAMAALFLWIAAFLSPLVGQAETKPSRFASLWTREAEFSEPELLTLSQDAEPFARQFSALRLAELDPPSEAALAALVHALGDPSEEVRLQALAGLMRLGRPATRVLAEALSDLEPVAAFDDPYSQELRQVSRSDLAFTALIHVRSLDVDALLSGYSAAPPDVEEISIEEGADSKPATPASPRQRIRLALEQVPPQITPSLQKALQADDVALRVTVAHVMGRAGAGAADAVPFLTARVVEDRAAPVRQAAAFALAEIPEPGLHALRGLLENKDPEVRGFALAAYPVGARDNFKVVAEFLRDPAGSVRQTALRQIGSSEWYRDRYRSEFLAGMLELLVQELTKLAKTSDTPTRSAAVRALGVLGSERGEHSPAVADALAALLSDPSDEVASEAVHALAWLVARTDIPPPLKAPRKAAVETLVKACLSQRCQCVETILSERPDWRRAVTDALVARLPEAHSYDEDAFQAFESLGAESPTYSRELKRFLDHPERALRLRAAAALAKRKVISPRLWAVLEEGARYSGEDRESNENEAAEELAGLGEQGVERLLAILREPSTAPLTRQALRHVLEWSARESPSVADFILDAAADSTDPDTQAWAIQQLDSIDSPQATEPALFERAFSTGDAGVRAVAVASWPVDQAPGDLMERVFADSAPEVRSRGFLLLRRLPKEDSRRVAFTASALQDEDESVREEGLRFAGELGEAGGALLEQHAVSGRSLTPGFFDGVEKLGALGGVLVKPLENRADDEPSEVQRRILEALSSAEMRSAVDRQWLLSRLEAPDAIVRERAAEILYPLLQVDPWTEDGRIAEILTEAEVRTIARQRLINAHYLLAPANLSRSERSLCPSSRGSVNSSPTRQPRRPALPRFPWPPPPGYSRVLVPRELFAVSEETKLGDIYRRLVGAIEAAGEGFEHGLFSGPDSGFSLVARMERIEPDGTPLPEPARWMEGGSPKLSLGDLLADLFFEKPGYFRVIVFTVTENLATGQSASTRLPEFEAGAAGMPVRLAWMPFGEKEVLALVYTFERKQGARIMPWQGDGAPSARQHLEKSGVWTRLGASSRQR